MFRGIFMTFAVFGNTYVLIPLFLWELLTIFCGTLRFRGAQFEKHWCNVLQHRSSRYSSTARGSREGIHVYSYLMFYAPVAFLKK